LGLLLGLLVILGDDLALPDFEAIFRSLSSLGIGGTGGTPFWPATTTSDFRREAFAVSRKTVLGEGWPEELVPEADDPSPESGKESRLEVGDGEDALEDDRVCGFKVGSRVIADDAAFFSNEEARPGRGSSSLTMMVCEAAWGGWLSRLAIRLASVGLIVLAPRPLAPGMKLVRRECELSLLPTESLLRALPGDMGSFSILPLVRVNGGTANRSDFVVAGGPINVVTEDVVLVRL
jgi:hypothetical protein